MTHALLLSGQEISFKGKEWLVENVAQDGRAYVRHRESQTELIISLAEQQKAYAENQLSLLIEKPKRQKHERSDLLGLSPKEFAEFERQKDYIRLVSKRAGNCGRKSLEIAIQEVGGLLGDASPPHVSTYYRWVRSHKQALSLGQISMPAHSNKGNRRSRLSGAVVDIICQFLERYYLDEQRASLRATWHLVVAHINMLNKAKLKGEEYALPGYAAVRGVLKSHFTEYDTYRRRHGKRAAHMKFRLAGKSTPPDYPMQIVELDHTLTDLIQLNGELTALLGRADCAVGIDAYSGMPVGVYLGFEPPSTQSLFSLIRNILLPKTYVQSRWPQKIAQKWDCDGPPGSFAFDRGLENKGKAAIELCSTVGISMIINGARRPYQKGNVERFWGAAAADFFQRLPGTTFSNIEERGDYDSMKKACLAYEEVERLLHYWLIEVFANQPRNPNDNRSRREIWNEGQSKRPVIPLRPVTDYGIFMCGRAEPKLNGHGVRIHNEFYISSALEDLRKSIGDVKVPVRYDPADMGTAQIYSKQSDEWIVANNTDPLHRGCSLHQLKLEHRFRRGAGSEAQRALPGAVYKLAFQEEVDRTVKASRKKMRKLQKIDARAQRIGIDPHSREYDKQQESSLPVVKPKSSLRKIEIDMSEFDDDRI